MLYLNRIFACVYCNSYQKKTKVECGINEGNLSFFFFKDVLLTLLILSEIL